MAKSTRTQKRTPAAQAAEKTAGVSPQKKAAAAAEDASGQPAASTPPTGAPAALSAVAALEEDHRRVEQLFAEYQSAQDQQRKEELVRLICLELVIHAPLPLECGDLGFKPRETRVWFTSARAWTRSARAETSVACRL
jgi:hypothetical protein